MQNPKTSMNVPVAMRGRWPYLSKREPVKHDAPKVRNVWTDMIHDT
jgi:hypothetical protein